MAEITLASLMNRIRKLEEEVYTLRNSMLPKGQSDRVTSGLTPFTGFVDGGGGYGVAEDLFISSNWGDAVERAKLGEPELLNRLCLKAVDGKVMSRQGKVGDLWLFVVETSPNEDGDTQKIAVSGWAY